MNSPDNLAARSRRHFFRQIAGVGAGVAAPAIATKAAAAASGGARMKPRVTVITIGVDDLERSLRFYRDGLGLESQGIIGTEFENGAVAFFDLEGGSRLALWPRKSIAHDSGVPVSGHSPTEFTLGHNVRSQAEVDAVMAQAKKAGAVIVKPATKTFWGGYAGYFKDPDQHLWEVLYNPQFLPKE
jgi:catechol 2,3-dioxygenase-like lactoylglutathione lyase family enzyme